MTLGGTAPGLARQWRGTAVVSGLATVLSWRPYSWRKVTATVDPSWQAGLAEGFVHHLQWGPSLLFTFGPYGLVDNILPFSRFTAFLAVMFAVVVTWGLAALVVTALRPSWTLIGAGVVAWAAIAVANSRTGYADLAGATALGLALTVLNLAPGRARWVCLGLLGGLTGFELLAKFNDGLVGAGLVVVVVALVELPRAKAALVASVPLVGVALIAWVAAGQSLGNVWSYLRGSFSISVGYTSAMNLGMGRRADYYYAAVVLALLGLVFLLALRPGARAREARRRQLATALVLAGWVWAAVKEGFVRHDAHDLTFFGLVLVALALARVRRLYLPIQAGALVTALVLACVAAGGPPVQLHSPGASTAAFADDVGAVLGLGGFGGARSEMRAQLLASGGSLPPAALSMLSRHTVAMEPTQAVLAFIYPGLDWRPEPVLQGYSAYTTYLDRLNATFLASSRAPERILYQRQDTIDGRDPWNDPPATLESMYCHYVELAAYGDDQVLARLAPGPGRCGRPVLVERVRAHFGDAVVVPREPGRMVTATFSFSVPLVADLEGVVLKPPAMSFTTWSRAHERNGARYRFVPGTAADPHVLSVPAALGYSAGFTPPPVGRLELGGGGWSTGDGNITVSFYAVRLGAPGRAALVQVTGPGSPGPSLPAGRVSGGDTVHGAQSDEHT